MAGSLNKVEIIGNVGNDPDIKSLNSGDRVANFSVATSETWKDKSTGEKRERTEWHRIVVFGDGLVRVIENYVRKGSKLYVCGALQTRKYDKGGVETYTTEIVLKPFNGELILLSGKDDGASGGGERRQASAPAQSQARNLPVEDDEIPF